MSQMYFRPLATPLTDPNGCLPAGTFRLAGGWCGFDRVEVLERGRAPHVVPASQTPAVWLDRLTAPRAPLAGLTLDRPRLMGVLNVTPDSFSDGGRFAGAGAVAHAHAMIADGADILDIGGESTRPGASLVPAAEEIARIVPIISAVRAGGATTPISLDTRKREVAVAGVAAGADMLNDVSAFAFDATLGPWAADRCLPTCLMHSQGTPDIMQDDPRYGDALLDVYDMLEDRVAAAVAMGLPRAAIVVDPGIGFGKTDAHILAILRRIGLFHGLGCAIVLGVSRKSFIGRLDGGTPSDARLAGTLAVTLAGLGQGVQINRVHDVAEAAQAIRLWSAVTFDLGAFDG
jgi:dihydropteroate synthase